jgi:signal transduction histidine kinase
MRALQRWLPASLFGRLMIVLVVGLLLAQLLSAAINVAERDRLLAGSFGLQPAQRIADVVTLLDGLGPDERQRVVAVFSAPPLVLSLHDAPRIATGAGGGWRASMFAARVHAALGDERPVRVEPREGFAADALPGGPSRWYPPMAGGGPGMMGRGPGGLGPAAGLGPGGGMAVLRAEVQLRDGRWARFDTELPPGPEALPWRLVATLGVLLLTMLGLSYVAVRWVVQPLKTLAQAADALGRDLHQPPLPEDGPLEVRQAARAFNTMQRRLAGFIDERARLLTALSHDLKTPLTRMRLRAELLDDDEQRTRFEADLLEMETMVTQTLEFMRGLGGHEARTAVDVDALLQSLRDDRMALGQALPIDGRAREPYRGVASLLKRCLGNLVDNAFAYGGSAALRVEDSDEQLVLHVLDDGPGIDEAQLEQVFEPFVRLEASRGRSTGGTGLGLGIARAIARAHGGDVVLQRRSQRGLDAVLSLPRRTVP